MEPELKQDATPVDATPDTFNGQDGLVSADPHGLNEICDECATRERTCDGRRESPCTQCVEDSSIAICRWKHPTDPNSLLGTSYHLPDARVGWRDAQPWTATPSPSLLPDGIGLETERIVQDEDGESQTSVHSQGSPPSHPINLAPEDSSDNRAAELDYDSASEGSIYEPLEPGVGLSPLLECSSDADKRAMLARYRPKWELDYDSFSFNYSYMRVFWQAVGDRASLIEQVRAELFLERLEWHIDLCTRRSHQYLEALRELPSAHIVSRLLLQRRDLDLAEEDAQRELDFADAAAEVAQGRPPGGGRSAAGPLEERDLGSVSEARLRALERLEADFPHGAEVIPHRHGMRHLAPWHALCQSIRSQLPYLPAPDEHKLSEISKSLRNLRDASPVDEVIAVAREWLARSGEQAHIGVVYSWKGFDFFADIPTASNNERDMDRILWIYNQNVFGRDWDTVQFCGLRQMTPQDSAHRAPMAQLLADPSSTSQFVDLSQSVGRKRYAEDTETRVHWALNYLQWVKIQKKMWTYRNRTEETRLSYVVRGDALHQEVVNWRAAFDQIMDAYRGTPEVVEENKVGEDNKPLEPEQIHAMDKSSLKDPEESAEEDASEFTERHSDDSGYSPKKRPFEDEDSTTSNESRKRPVGKRKPDRTNSRDGRGRVPLPKTSPPRRQNSRSPVPAWAGPLLENGTEMDTGDGRDRPNYRQSRKGKEPVRQLARDDPAAATFASLAAPGIRDEFSYAAFQHNAGLFRSYGRAIGESEGARASAGPAELERMETLLGRLEAYIHACGSHRASVLEELRKHHGSLATLPATVSLQTRDLYFHLADAEQELAAAVEELKRMLSLAQGDEPASVSDGAHGGNQRAGLLGLDLERLNPHPFANDPDWERLKRMALEDDTDTALCNAILAAQYAVYYVERAHNWIELWRIGMYPRSTEQEIVYVLPGDKYHDTVSQWRRGFEQLKREKNWMPLPSPSEERNGEQNQSSSGSEETNGKDEVEKLQVDEMVHQAEMAQIQNTRGKHWETTRGKQAVRREPNTRGKASTMWNWLPNIPKLLQGKRTGK